ncbi:MAG TPA: helix-turn-helix domain-containing protein [Jatrophihabitans sp.]|nr:helix-turn-helix domain-containing protein [Jatrophihabitans sp.]
MSSERPDDLASRAELAAALTRLRESAGLSVRDLARSIGAPPGTLGDYLSGRHLPSAAQLPIIRRALERCGVTDADEIERWFAAIRRIRTATDRRGTRASQTPSPYRGLAAFEPEDAELFFGRDAETEAILAELRELARDGGPSRGVVAVIGPSGAGKSSLLRAGVVAAVRAGRIAEHGSACVVTTPGSSPARSFAAAVATLAADAGDAGRGVLVLDQLEELFTLAPDAAREEFLTALERRDPGILAVLGMRADFYSAAAREPALLPALQHAQILVGPLDEQSLRSAVVEPARRVGASLEDSLADVVLAELAPRGTRAHDVGVLPLLSHAMLATWQRAAGNRLTVADYRATGGIDGAIQRSAESVYSGLTDDERELARRAFLRMVTIDDVAVTRRRVSPLELAQLDDGAGRVRAVVGRFVAGRLVTADEAAVAISHEALLSAWPRLRDWVDADRDGLRLRRQLTEAAEAWQAAGRDETLVLRGSRLERAREWATAHTGELTRPEQDFLDASVERAEADARDEQRRTRRRRQLVAVFAVLALVATGFAVYGLRARATAISQAHAAAQARNDALSRQVAIESVRLRATQPALADQLALAAYRISATADARSALIDGQALPTATRIVGPAGPTAAVAAAPARAVLATAAADDSVRLWAVHPVGPPTAIGTLRPPGKPATLFTVAFSPDGRTLAASGTSETVQLWDVTDLAHPRPLGTPLTGPTNSVYGVTFSPDGHELAAASADGNVYRWDVRDRTSPSLLPRLPKLGGYVYSVAFSPDGSTLVAGSDTSVSVWDVAAPEPRRVATFPSPDGSPVRAVAINPAGTLIAAGTENGTVVEYPAGGPTGAHGVQLPGASHWVNSLAFSPDGRTLLGGSSDTTVRIWSTRSHTLLRTIPHTEPVTGVAYLGNSTFVAQLNDGTTVLQPTTAPGMTAPRDAVDELGYTADGSLLVAATGDGDQHADVWRTQGDTAHLLTRAIAPPAPLTASPAALPSPDGRLLAMGTDQGSVLLWNISNPTAPRLAARPAGPSSQVVTVAFSPNSHLLAAGYLDHSIRIWDVTDPTRPRPLGSPAGCENYVLNIGFSPDGHVLAAGCADDTVRLWNVAQPQRPVEIATLDGFSSYLYSVAFSPNGRLLAAAGGDKQIHLFDMSDPRHPRPVARISGPTDYVYNVAFDPRNPRILAASSKDGTVRLWRLTRVAPGRIRSTELATLDAAGPDAVNGLAFSPDGHTLAAAGDDKVVRLWDLGVHADARRICADSGTPITRAEWHQYVPGAPYDAPCR